jgi:putative transposase
MCQLAQVSRAGFYRYLRGGWPAEEEMTLRSVVQEIVLEHRWRYGYRRVSEELRLRGMIANHKRIARIMREDNLLKVRHPQVSPRELSVRAVQIYLNLAATSKRLYRTRAELPAPVHSLSRTRIR